MDLVYTGKTNEEFPFMGRNPMAVEDTTFCFDEEYVSFLEYPASYGVSESGYMTPFSSQHKIPIILRSASVLRVNNTIPVKFVIENVWPVDPTAEEVRPGTIRITNPSLWAISGAKSEYVGFWKKNIASTISDITIPTKMDYDSDDVQRKLKPTHDLVKRLVSSVFGDIGIEAKVWPDPEEDIWYIEYYIEYTDNVKTNVEKKAEFYKEYRLSRNDSCHNRIILSFIYAD